MNEVLIDLRAWRQFVAVAEELHFGRAALRLHMTQPPVTQAIAQLEKTLGVVLFDRTRRRVALTPAGEALLPDVRELLARAQALPARARAAAAGQVGRVRIAFVSTVGFEQLPAWVREFRVLCPEVALELVEATGDVQLEAFARGEIDAGLMLHSPGAAPPGLTRLAVSEEPLVLALPARHALARTETLLLADVLAEPLVIFPRRIVPSLHDAIFGLYHAAGRVPQLAQEAIQMQTIVNLVSGDIGVAWVPESVTQFRRAGVVYRRAAEFAPAARRRSAPALPVCETSLVWPEGANNPALARFVAFVRERG
ncbi:DNA-binding transcriptional LysR family regulator [Variovorax boronicumulans]|uniref:DNA-binding transcriptional LysR family regulator n=1 Tax=Variovorax boronicumulans TaxID=436515 RepID=A0AAW8D220_9BURK|nr:LysR family transcriptional regulator [Variovorax boronicumulans]MDP9893891.1 DNA-binding transcriptional LysR family regulator [Variovorax boronicumulans]MDP9993436.1 DNA-binding transcriptional LysR family regulator [Variovorax boronicumulans]MDQ0004697.1 DNA-binding transcriptional LysR family regulator [Variovorax boronicumulans]MDQ0053708.1 DNA-binding transcriptional LysR family regulator [Variovorax boronicumulans]